MIDLVECLQLIASADMVIAVDQKADSAEGRVQKQGNRLESSVKKRGWDGRANCVIGGGENGRTGEESVIYIPGTEAGDRKGGVV